MDTLPSANRTLKPQQSETDTFRSLSTSSSNSVGTKSSEAIAAYLQQEMSELQCKNLKDLKQTALDMGIGQALIDGCEDHAVPKAAIIQLILPKKALDPKATPLCLSLKALKQTARDMGAGRDITDNFDDRAEPRVAAIELIVSWLEAMIELKRLTLADLKKRAREMGATRDEIDALDNNDDPHAAGIQLICKKKAQQLQAADVPREGKALLPGKSITLVEPPKPREETKQLPVAKAVCRIDDDVQWRFCDGFMGVWSWTKKPDKTVDEISQYLSQREHSGRPVEVHNYRTGSTHRFSKVSDAVAALDLQVTSGWVVAKQADGHAEIVLKSDEGQFVAKVTNGEALIILQSRPGERKVRWKQSEGWAKASNLKASSPAPEPPANIVPAPAPPAISDPIRDVVFAFNEPSLGQCAQSLQTLSEDVQRAVKGLLGTAIGDAIGLPFELHAHVANRKRLDTIISWRSVDNAQDTEERKNLMRNFVLELFRERMVRAEGSPFGRTFSDDTVCTDLKMQTIAAVRTAVESHGGPLSVERLKPELFKEMLAQYLVWAHGADGQLFQGYGAFTKDLLRPDRNRLADLSAKLYSAGECLWQASPAASKIIPSPQYLEFAEDHFRGNSWGNGAVMSFTPGLLLSRCKDAPLLAQAATELAMSHRHPTAIVAAKLLEEILGKIHAGEVTNCGDIPRAVLRCQSWVEVVMPLREQTCNYMYPISAFAAFLDSCGVEAELTAATEFIRNFTDACVISGDDRFGPLGQALRVAANYDDDMQGERLAVRGNPSELVRFSQRGLNSVLIAIWCAAGAKTCWDWLEKILYIGGDSDTIGAVAGQIACPLLSTRDVVENFSTFVALDNHSLLYSHPACGAAARRYFHRAVLFARGQWKEVLAVPRLTDPYYADVTEKSGMRLLGTSRRSCKFGRHCTDMGYLHRERFSHPDKTRPDKTRCKFGAKCYNKSPNHLAAYSHPGDAEFGAEHQRRGRLEP